MSASRFRFVLLGSAVATCVSGIVLAEHVPESSAGNHTAVERVRKAHEGLGSTTEPPGLHDPDPAARIQALKSLAEAGDLDGKNFALEALDDPDQRVQSKALDCLVQLKAKDAAPALVQRMFLKGSTPPLRKRILLTLGSLGDAETARELLDYASNETDPGLRGSAIYAVGHLADPSLAGALRGFVEQEKDPGIRRVASDALARVSSRKAP